MIITLSPKITVTFFVFLIALGLNNVHGQKRVEGIVLNEEKKPIANSTVNIELNEGRIISVNTDTLGVFRFNGVASGKVKLEVRNVSYKNFMATFELAKDTLLFIKLLPSERKLEEVTISSSKPVFERKIDRFVFNVSNSPLVVGNTLWEVLKQTPMLQVSEPSRLGILGSPQDATVFINHRKFALAGEDLSNFLKNMPSDNIIQIEILTIPPPSYDASGPVIDILLKRLDINGLKVSSTATYETASKDRGKLATLLDYNRNKFNQSLLLSYSDGDYFKSIDKTSTFTEIPSTVVSNINLNSRRKGFNAYTDLSYNLSPVTTIGAQVIYNDFSLRTNADGKESVNPGNINSSYSQRILSGNNLLNANGYFRYNSTKNSRYLEITTDYLRVRNTQDNNFLSSPTNTGFRTIAPQHITTYSAKADFNSKVFGSYLLNSGLKYSNSEVLTPYEAFDVQNSQFIRNGDLSARFTYKEDVVSAYGTLERQFGKKWSAKFGFRMENTNIRTVSDNGSLTNNSVNYTFIFPTGYLNYVPNEKHSFSLTSKISNTRPDYSSLNPARTLVGNRTITEGNPFLRPSSGGIIEFMYSYKRAYYFGATYSRYNRLFTQLNQVLNDDTLLIKWENWGNQEQYNFWIFTSKEFFNKHLNVVFNSNLGYYRRFFNETVTNSAAMSDNLQLTLTLNQTVSNIFSKNLKMSLNSSFYTPSRYGLWVDQNSSFRFDFISSYSFPKQNLRLALMVNDILKYNDRNVYTVNNTDLQRTTVLNNNDSRSLRISLTKSFGNLKTRNLQKRETSNEDEKSRSQ